MKRKIIYLLSVLHVTVGCVSEFNADLPVEDSEMLVIEGNIISNSPSLFYLSRGFSLDESRPSSEALDVMASLVVVGSDGYQSDPAVYLGEGKYQIDVGVLNDDHIYNLKIWYNGDIYLSEPSFPLETPEIDSVSWIQSEYNGDVSIRVSTHDDANRNDYYKWSYEEDWETKMPYDTRWFYDPITHNLYSLLSNPFYHCWKKGITNSILIASSESLAENRITDRVLNNWSSSDDRFSSLYSVLVTQQALSKPAFTYFQDKKKLNEDMGGLFTPQPYQVRGNVHCETQPAKMVMGYVEVLKNISQKRIFIESDEISKKAPMCLYPADFGLNGGGITQLELYNAGFLPISIETWIEARCVNCIRAGGTKDKPHWWPTDHY